LHRLGVITIISPLTVDVENTMFAVHSCFGGGLFVREAIMLHMRA